MKKRYFLLGALVLSYLCILLLAILSENIYYLDLASSLLPYWIGLNLLFLIGIVLAVLRRSNTPAVVFLKSSGVAVALVTFCLMVRVAAFSYVNVPGNAGTEDVKIAFFNKLYSNTNYGEIDSKVTALHPDIIGFSEMKEVDKGNIAPLKQYQCTLSKNARDGATIALYSSFPCTNNSNAPQLPFVLPAEVKMYGKTYEVFVIHPVPPSNTAWIRNRNSELAALSRYINSLPSDRVVVLGDFNLSPWSRAFFDFSNNTRVLKDVAQGTGLHFTWHGKYIATQIDHIFVPKGVLVDTFRSEYVNGSDHNIIWTNIRL